MQMITKETIYLDTNIFITFYLKRDGFDKINNFFKENSNLEVEFVTSDWTLTEIVKVLIYEYNEKPKNIADYIQELQREKRIFETKFSFIEVCKKEKYDFGEFFYHIQKILLEYNSGFADSIHSLIMRNNKIKYILTSDDQGFQGIKNITVINPLKLGVKYATK